MRDVRVRHGARLRNTPGPGHADGRDHVVCIIVLPNYNASWKGFYESKVLLRLSEEYVPSRLKPV
jgi:hypothetical protein